MMINFKLGRELMNKIQKIALGLSIIAMISVGNVICNVTAEAATTFQQRIASIINDEEQVNLVFYLDADGYTAYEKKVVDTLVDNIQKKLPIYATLKHDSKFLGDFDLFREEKYDALLNQMYKDNPAYAAYAAQMNTVPTAMHAGGAPKVKVTEELLGEYLKDTEYDGMVIVRVDQIQQKASTNYVNAILFGFGGVNTKVEMDVTIRVFNKNSDNKYVFSNRQRVIGKISGTWAPDTAAKRALPMALKEIDTITVK